MADDDKGTTETAHHPGARKGEEAVSREGKEPGHHEKGESHADRPTGTTTARSSTGINPEDMDSIDPSMPNMPPA